MPRCIRAGALALAICAALPLSCVRPVTPTAGPTAAPTSTMPPVMLDDACMNNAKQVAISVMQYLQDYDEKFPPMRDASAVPGLLTQYTRDSTVFACPVVGKPYTYNRGLSGRKIMDVRPAITMLLSDPQAHPDGLWTIGYADGHVKRETLPSRSGAGRLSRR